MYLKLTEHFVGQFPVDVGGLKYYGYGHKEVSDEFGDRCAKANFPYVVPCDKDGNALVEVPPITKVEAVVAPPPVEAVKVVEDADGLPTVTTEEDKSPVTIVENLKRRRKA